MYSNESQAEEPIGWQSAIILNHTILDWADLIIVNHENVTAHGFGKHKSHLLSLGKYGIPVPY